MSEKELTEIAHESNSKNKMFIQEIINLINKEDSEIESLSNNLVSEITEISNPLSPKNSKSKNSKFAKKLALFYSNNQRHKVFQYIFINKDSITNLAEILWYSSGIISIVINEILEMYSTFSLNLSKESIVQNYNILYVIQILVRDKEIKNRVIEGKTGFFNEIFSFIFSWHFRIFTSFIKIRH